jgi:hypothetical protein
MKELNQLILEEKILTRLDLAGVKKIGNICFAR